MITLNHYLTLGGILFVIGLFGALAKKNAVAVLMGIELMLNAVNINLVAFNRFLNPDKVVGQVFAIFVIVVAAVEVAVGLAIVINLYRQRLNTSIDEADWLKW
ncbi:NADH dehydrogenase subunit K [Thermanaeromonas toyohensis ToBE]|uniref:NADH-quinone oxidoreductase subunit K n=1 Tax=Thermanaeromonas toyohensis ToBE TaxID=698762 RepID=A0A1W1VR35_9FIRM|nr:NADH-quinone oxidoreductase subunit NuoK [Thermanaeromonas toyohensis]SMB95384.1 NADH dehydrogenase subunit K [Thermanaeromonas toyohensis ToBE]